MANTTTENSNKNIAFYRDRFPQLLMAICIAIAVLLVISLIVLYQVFHRPTPLLQARAPNGSLLTLTPHDSPNLAPDTILHWASEAIVAAYTFSFDPTYAAQQAALARPYFTKTGWGDYQSSVASLMRTVVQNQLFVNSVVYNPPIIASQGDIGNGYTWEIQVPLLVTYQSSEKTVRNYYLVLLSIQRVQASENPAGIGINRFVVATSAE